jgi:hypothetical protein
MEPLSQPVVSLAASFVEVSIKLQAKFLSK